MKYCLKCWRKLLLLILVATISILANSQPNLTFYPFDDQFNSFEYNPAFLTSREIFTFSILPLGGTTFAYNHQAEIRNMVSKLLNGVSTDDDYKTVLKSMVGQSTFHQNFETSLLNFTYRSNIGFINFRIKEYETFSALLVSDLTKFIFKSDIRSVGIDQIQNLPAQGFHLREYSLGYSYTSRMNRFSVGIRAKAYFGKSAFYSGISASIQNESSDYFLRTSGWVYLSFPETKAIIQDGTPNISINKRSNTINYIMNNGNPGFGADLGFRYRITKELTLSMSAIDLGKINWNTNLNSKSFNGEYLIPPGSYASSTTNKGVHIITKTSANFSYSDSISKIFDLAVIGSKFSKPMPLTIYAGVKYQLNPNSSISLTNRLLIVEYMNSNSFSCVINHNLNKNISISSGYSIIGDSYINIPFALLFKQDFGQMYIGTDNLASIVAPIFSNFTGVSFGACFYLFTKRDLFGNTSDDLPFYKPRKIKKNRKNGHIIKSYPEY